MTLKEANNRVHVWGTGFTLVSAAAVLSAMRGDGFFEVGFIIWGVIFWIATYRYISAREILQARQENAYERN